MKLNNESTKIIHNYLYGPVRNILLGSGLCYAIENKFYLHIPVIFFFPSIYVGYHTYKNKDNIKLWLNNK